LRSAKNIAIVIVLHVKESSELIFFDGVLDLLMLPHMKNCTNEKNCSLFGQAYASFILCKINKTDFMNE